MNIHTVQKIYAAAKDVCCRDAASRQPSITFGNKTDWVDVEADDRDEGGEVPEDEDPVHEVHDVGTPRSVHGDWWGQVPSTGNANAGGKSQAYQLRQFLGCLGD